ncbi:putative autophagy-related protein 11 [Palaemon carinicauda]|uniref:putative autophagy-related protein 11 n=1 Tax=Palaemon carinicauda TaxID=392227 RepID=UPI0035B5780C
MAKKLNQLFGVWMNMFGEFVKGTYNLPQNAASVIQERNAACEEITLNLQGQLRTLQDSLVFKWFSWLLPEAPRFEDCRAVASQEGFFGRWLQRCPWIGGFWKAHEELRGCELALRHMEAEALRFNDQLRTRWFVGKLLREFNVGGVEEILSRGNKNLYYLALAAAGAIFGGIMLATRRMTKEDLKMKEQEKLLKNLKTEKEIINKVQNEKSELQNECIENEKLLEILKIENEALKKVQNQKTEQLKQLVNEVVELKRKKDDQERLKAKMASDYQNLEKAYNDKDLQMKKLKKLLENLKTENNGLKNLRKDPVNKLRNEEEELKAEKEKLESECENMNKECAKKDDQLKRQERLLEILENGHKGPKKFQKDHIIIWKNKVDELNAEKEEQKKLNAKMASDYQNLLKECAKKDLEMKKQERLLEILKTKNEATQAQKEQFEK